MIALEREVTATRAEFVRILGMAFPDVVVDDGKRLRVDGRDAVMEISLEPGPERRIALLCLPTLRVRIEFVEGSPKAQRAMLAHMDMAMQRGGG